MPEELNGSGSSFSLYSSIYAVYIYTYIRYGLLFLEACSISSRPYASANRGIEVDKYVIEPQTSKRNKPPTLFEKSARFFPVVLILIVLAALFVTIFRIASYPPKFSFLVIESLCCPRLRRRLESRFMRERLLTFYKRLLTAPLFF